MDGNSGEASVTFKVVLLVFVVMLISALAVFLRQTNQLITYYDTTLAEANEQQLPITKEQQTKGVDQKTSVAATSCDFSSVNPTLKKATKYDIIGGEEFDTLVCGYLTTKKEDMAMTGDAAVIKNRAYLNVVKFQDAKFQTALDKGIKEGNTVNGSTSGSYQLGCGCYENNKIVSDVGNLTDAASQVKLLATTAAKPVIIKLSFYIEGGRGCTCCNLLDKLEVL